MTVQCALVQRCLLTHRRTGAPAAATGGKPSCLSPKSSSVVPTHSNPCRRLSVAAGIDPHPHKWGFFMKHRTRPAVGGLANHECHRAGEYLTASRMIERHKLHLNVMMALAAALVIASL